MVTDVDEVQTHSNPISPPLSSELPRPQILSPKVYYQHYVIALQKHHTIVVSRVRGIPPFIHSVGVHGHDIYGSKLARLGFTEGAIAHALMRSKQYRFEAFVGPRPHVNQTPCIDFGQ